MKRCISFLIIPLLCVSLISCGTESTGNGDDPAQTTENDVTTPSTDDDPAQTTENGDTTTDPGEDEPEVTDLTFASADEVREHAIRKAKATDDLCFTAHVPEDEAERMVALHGAAITGADGGTYYLFVSVADDARIDTFAVRCTPYDTCFPAEDETVQLAIGVTDGTVAIGGNTVETEDTFLFTALIPRTLLPRHNDVPSSYYLSLYHGKEVSGFGHAFSFYKLLSITADEKLDRAFYEKYADEYSAPATPFSAFTCTSGKTDAGADYLLMLEEDFSDDAFRGFAYVRISDDYAAMLIFTGERGNTAWVTEALASFTAK